MSPRREQLVEWLEEQAEFGALPLPKELDPQLFRESARWSQALKDKTPAGKAKASTAGSPARSAPAGESEALSLRPAAAASGAATPPVSAPLAPRAATTVLPPFSPLWSSLDELRAAVCACGKCALAARRTQTVFGVGSPEADLVIVGEAPGDQEDLQGEPFVGPAGQLLNKMLEAIGFARQDVFICNTVKCHPPGNRDPQPAELAACRSFLDHQLHFLKPKLLLGLGKVAGQALLGRQATLGSMRGVEHVFQGLPLRITYHPAALLRNEHWKRPAWEDLKALRRRYDELGGRPSSPAGAAS